MNINTNRGEIFIPETHGNVGSGSPIKFHLRFLTIEEQGEAEYFEYIYVKDGKSPRVGVKLNHSDIFKKGVERIEGCEHDGKQIEKPEEFLAIRGPKWMATMVAEVVSHLRVAMEIDSKN